jgi:hypothetical protein
LRKFKIKRWKDVDKVELLAGIAILAYGIILIVGLLGRM